MFTLCLFLWNFCLKKHYFLPIRISGTSPWCLGGCRAKPPLGPVALEMLGSSRCTKIHQQAVVWPWCVTGRSWPWLWGYGEWFTRNRCYYSSVWKFPPTQFCDLGLLQSIPSHFIAGFIMDYHLRSLEMRWFKLRQGKSPKDRERQQEPHHNWVFRRNLSQEPPPLWQPPCCDSQGSCFTESANRRKPRPTGSCWKLQGHGCHGILRYLEPWRPIPGLCFLNSQPSAENYSFKGLCIQRCEQNMSAYCSRSVYSRA